MRGSKNKPNGDRPHQVEVIDECTDEETTQRYQQNTKKVNFPISNLESNFLE